MATFTPLPDESQHHSGNAGQATSSGTPIAKIATKQIAISRSDIAKFSISEKLIKEHPALVHLILQTESMKDEERKYWFQLLPTMTAVQVQKLQDILQNERDQLDALDTKYATEVAKLNDQHLVKWKAVEARRKRKHREERERNDQVEEEKEEQSVLDELNNL